MTKPPSGRGRHSFVQFYMSDWLAGTARMTRLMRSIYFDICCYVWDKAEPVPKGELALMVSDIDGQSASDCIDMLIASGQLVEDERGIFSPRAMAEAQRAFSAWRGKSEGGKKSVGTKPQDTSQVSSIEPEPEPEPKKERGADAPPKKARPKKPAAEKPVEPKPPAVPRAAKAMIPQLWNEIAAATGLTEIKKVSADRSKKLDARIAEHGVNAILDAMRTIPQSRFLMGKTAEGWKAHFDWLLQASSLQKLIEGFYHNDGPGKQSAWTK